MMTDGALQHLTCRADLALTAVVTWELAFRLYTRSAAVGQRNVVVCMLFYLCPANQRTTTPVDGSLSRLCSVPTECRQSSCATLSRHNAVMTPDALLHIICDAAVHCCCEVSKIRHNGGHNGMLVQLLNMSACNAVDCSDFLVFSTVYVATHENDFLIWPTLLVVLLERCQAVRLAAAAVDGQWLQLLLNPSPTAAVFLCIFKLCLDV